MRAANMQALTNDLKVRFQGVTIYGVGDEAHKLSPSDHNEDDTPGSRSEQQDSDNVPEHRAIDVMIGAAFFASDAEALVRRMVADAPTQRRLTYVIWNRFIYSASNGWARGQYFGDDPHINHVHISGLASNDEDASAWPIVYGPAAPVSPTGKRRDMRPFLIIQPEDGSGICLAWPSDLARGWVFTNVVVPGAKIAAPTMVDAFLAMGCIDARGWKIPNLSGFIALSSIPQAKVELGNITVPMGPMTLSGTLDPAVK